MFDMSGIDTALPRDCFDYEILNETTAEEGLEARKINGGDTPMTSVILKVRLALLSKQIVSGFPSPILLIQISNPPAVK